ncbi:MAG: hypothetical protein M1134_02680 [Actinobacteria bacterium]|nr:hypothetical protein [Actinomycetota bacterium]
MTLTRCIDELLGAVGIEDGGERSDCVRSVVASDFLYVDPRFVAASPKGLVDAFGWFRSEIGDEVEIVRTSEVEVNHDYFSYTWAQVRDGETVAEGFAFGCMDRSGQIRQIVNFEGQIAAPKCAYAQEVA